MQETQNKPSEENKSENPTETTVPVDQSGNENKTDDGAKSNPPKVAEKYLINDNEGEKKTETHKTVEDESKKPEIKEVTLLDKEKMKNEKPKSNLTKKNPNKHYEKYVSYYLHYPTFFILIQIFQLFVNNILVNEDTGCSEVTSFFIVDIVFSYVFLFASAWIHIGLIPITRFFVIKYFYLCYGILYSIWTVVACIVLDSGRGECV